MVKRTRYQKPLPMDGLQDMVFPTGIMFYAIHDYKGEDVTVNGTPVYMWWKRKLVNVQSYEHLIEVITYHIQTHRRTKKVLVRTSGRTWQFNRNLGSEELGAHIIRKSPFTR